MIDQIHPRAKSLFLQFDTLVGKSFDDIFVHFTLLLKDGHICHQSSVDF